MRSRRDAVHILRSIAVFITDSFSSSIVVVIQQFVLNSTPGRAVKWNNSTFVSVDRQSSIFKPYDNYSISSLLATVGHFTCIFRAPVIFRFSSFSIFSLKCQGLATMEWDSRIFGASRRHQSLVRRIYPISLLRKWHWLIWDCNRLQHLLR